MMPIIGISYVLLISLSGGESRPYSDRDECSTAECQHVADYIQEHMDTRVNPCNNFYDFACGQFARSRDTDANSFTQVANITINQIRDILTEEITDKDSMAIQKAKLFYSSCVNDGTHKTEPILPIYQKIKELGGWPTKVNHDDVNDINHVLPTVKQARHMGFDPHAIFTINIVPDVKDTSKRILVITPPALIIPIHRDGPNSQHYEKTVMDYCVLMILVGFQFLQYSEPFSNHHEEGVQVKLFSQVFEVLKFELALAKIYPKSYSGKDVFESYNIRTVEEIQRTYPFLNWLEFIQTALGETVVIDEHEPIILSGFEYFENLQKLCSLQKYRKLVKNYIVWRYILYSLRASLILVQEARWKACIAMSLAGFEAILAPKYIENHFSSVHREPVIDMVHRIKKVMYKMFQKYSWIDSITRKNILEKIDAIVMRVAYTDDMMNNDAKYNEFFASLTIDPDDYFSSVLRLIKMGLDSVAASLREPINRNEWPSYISTMSVNAYYVSIENSMTIPAALLQKELYSPDRPHYLNYGAIGFIIGHELSHAFDNLGRFYDKYGRRNDSLWQPSTIFTYREKAQCFVNQYNEYMLESTGIHLNGMLTLGENMADNEGIITAYKAYQMWVKENGREKQLPKLNYTSEQMFWISLANVWCTRINEDALKIFSKLDPHAPSKFRVIGMVSNQETFAKDFKCPLGAPMNPRKKCTFN